MSTLNYPDKVGTRLQAQGTAAHPPTYTGFADCFHKTYSKEGLRGLFKGLTPNLVKVCSHSSIPVQQIY